LRHRLESVTRPFNYASKVPIREPYLFTVGLVGRVSRVQSKALSALTLGQADTDESDNYSVLESPPSIWSTVWSRSAVSPSRRGHAGCTPSCSSTLQFRRTGGNILEDDSCRSRETTTMHFRLPMVLLVLNSYILMVDYHLVPSRQPPDRHGSSPLFALPRSHLDIGNRSTR